MARGMSIIDHNSRDGIYGMLTISGGKLTTYRLMAERIVDIMCTEMGETRPCKTADEAVPPAKEARLYTIGHRLENVESRNEGPTHEQIICECEMATRAMLENVMDTLPKGQLETCVARCAWVWGRARAASAPSAPAGIAHERGDIDSERANGAAFACS